MSLHDIDTAIRNQPVYCLLWFVSCYLVLFSLFRK